MICPDCGQRMSAERTMRGSDLTMRILTSECGARFESREKLVKRLARASMEVRSIPPPPTFNATGSLPVDAGVRGDAAGESMGGRGGSVPSLFPVLLPSDPSQQSGSGARARRGRKDETDYDVAFLLLWEEARQQGKCGNKLPAFKSWQRIDADDHLNALILTRYQEWRKTDSWRRGFNQHLSTWLNQRGWEQSPTPVDLTGPVLARPGANGSVTRAREEATMNVLSDWLAKKKEPA